MKNFLEQNRSPDRLTAKGREHERLWRSHSLQGPGKLFHGLSDCPDETSRYTEEAVKTGKLTLLTDMSIRRPGAMS
jgi:hypothetical protein